MACLMIYGASAALAVAVSVQSVIFALGCYCSQLSSVSPTMVVMRAILRRAVSLICLSVFFIFLCVAPFFLEDSRLSCRKHY